MTSDAKTTISPARPARASSPTVAGVGPAPRERFAKLPVFSAMTALAAVLAAFANQYGYHRDELYFRMLPPDWGYVDQPPLTPILARLFSDLVADEAWALRIPAIIFAVASVWVVALIAREVGGGRLAQGLAAWGYAFGTMTLSMGHVFLTASVDLLVWPAVILVMIRALLRKQPSWWLVAGAIVGLSTYNKYLVAMLLASLAVGLLVAGPRRVLWSKWVLGGLAIAVVIGLPNIVYQAVNGWPQLEMGSALSASNADEVRVAMWPYLLVMIGPPLVPFWIAGLISLARRPQWRAIRSLVVAFPVLLVLVFLAGSQFYYPYGLLAALYAIGCVPVAEFARRSTGRRALVVAAVAVNSVVCGVMSLPVVPVGSLGATPIAAINAATADQVGWPQYVAEVERVAAAVGDDAVILATNYGEAGALARYGDEGLPSVYSGHNALHALASPPSTTQTVIVVGAMIARVEPFFETCTVEGELDNRLDVENEEQEQPVTVCSGPLDDWETIWPAMQRFN